MTLYISIETVARLCIKYTSAHIIFHSYIAVTIIDYVHNLRIFTQSVSLL